MSRPVIRDDGVFLPGEPVEPRVQSVLLASAPPSPRTTPFAFPRRLHLGNTILSLMSPALMPFSSHTRITHDHLRHPPRIYELDAGCARPSRSHARSPR